MTTDLDTHWGELLTVALLGTDRRDPPQPLAGPVGDVVADSVRDDASARLLADVAACVVVRRAAFVPAPAADRLTSPAPDQRPLCPVEAVEVWREIVATWPVLEDEWLLEVELRGWRLPPDVLVAALSRRRADPARLARVMAAGGPVAGWVLDHVPALGPARARSVATTAAAATTTTDAATTTVAATTATLPPLPVPPELEPLLTADAHTFVQGLLPGFHEARIGTAHRPVLVNLLARCRAEVLPATIEALGTVDPQSPSAGVAHVLADLAALRIRIHGVRAPG